LAIPQSNRGASFGRWSGTPAGPSAQFWLTHQSCKRTADAGHSKGAGMLRASRTLLAEVIRVEGASARDAGAPRKDNPYPEDSEEAVFWAQGWEWGFSRSDFGNPGR
jgi:hypothetical protein